MNFGVEEADLPKYTINQRGIKCCIFVNHYDTILKGKARQVYLYSTFHTQW